MTGTRRSSAGLDERRRRILFRSWHRGFREMDMIVGQFADAHLADMSDAELDVFEHLIDAPDHDIFGWLTGKIPTPSNYDTPIFKRVRDFHTHLGPIHV